MNEYNTPETVSQIAIHADLVDSLIQKGPSKELYEQLHQSDESLSGIDQRRVCLDYIEKLQTQLAAQAKVVEAARLAFLGWVNRKSDFAARMNRMNDAISKLSDGAEFKTESIPPEFDKIFHENQRELLDMDSKSTPQSGGEEESSVDELLRKAEQKLGW